VTGASECASFASKVHPAPQGYQPASDGNLWSAFTPQSGTDNLVPPTANEEWRGQSSTSVAPAMPAGYKMANRGAGVPFDNNDSHSVGIEMSVQIKYMENGNSDQCVVSQKFEYPRDRRSPPAPNIAQVSSGNTTPEAAAAGCGAGAASPGASAPTIRLGYDPSGGGGEEFERGTQFLCRDLSWKRTYYADSTAPFTSYIPCYKGGALESNISVLDLTTTAKSNEDVNNRDFSVRINQWVPCDELQQCGYSPSTKAYTDGTTGRTNPNDVGGAGIHELVLTYPSLPVGCVMNFEVVAVDTAGNISIAGNSSRRKFLETATAGVETYNEILPRKCGIWCNGGTWTSNYPRGYYTCRPAGICCSGAGCTAATN
jgi:hypothetical protein